MTYPPAWLPLDSSPPPGLARLAWRHCDALCAFLRSLVAETAGRCFTRIPRHRANGRPRWGIPWRCLLSSNRTILGHAAQGSALRSQHEFLPAIPRYLRATVEEKGFHGPNVVFGTNGDLLLSTYPETGSLSLEKEMAPWTAPAFQGRCLSGFQPPWH